MSRRTIDRNHHAKLLIGGRMNCKHTNLTPTGEIREQHGCQGCKDNPALKKMAPVLRCDDCGAYVQMIDGKPQLVGPPPQLEHVIPSLRTGRMSFKELRARGIFPEEVVAFLEAHIEPCRHEHTDRVVVTVCKDCGAQIGHEKQ